MSNTCVCKSCEVQCSLTGISKALQKLIAFSSPYETYVQYNAKHYTVLFPTCSTLTFLSCFCSLILYWPLTGAADVGRGLTGDASLDSNCIHTYNMNTTNYRIICLVFLFGQVTFRHTVKSQRLFFFFSRILLKAKTPPPPLN